MDEQTAKHAKGLGVRYTEIANLLDYLNNETRDKSEDISAAKLDELYNYAFSDMISVLEASKGSEVQSLLLDDRKAGQGVRDRAQQNLAVCFKMLGEVEKN